MNASEGGRAIGEAMPQATASPAVNNWPSPGRAWYALVVLTIGLMIATIDRGILTLLVQPIKKDLGLSDTQFTMLHGWAFVSVYAVLGLPIARLADRSSRRVIIAIGMAFWSLMTALCGFANTFTQFFLARAGVGAGESAYAPAVYSILQDSFRPEKLPRVFAIMAIGFSYGTSFGVILGAGLVVLATDLTDVFAPYLGVLKPWQIVLLLCALPGIALALAMFTVQEPRRRGLLPGASADAAVPIKLVTGFFHANGRTYYPMFTAMGIKAMLSFGSGFWMPELMRRTFDWPVAKTAITIGVLGIIIAPFALLLGSYITERFARQGRDDANLRTLLIASTLAIPTSIAFPLMSDPYHVMAVWALNYFIIMMGVGPSNAALQMITPNQMRGQIRAAFQFVFNVIGFGLGATTIAFCTDYVFQDEADLKYSLAVVAAVIGPLAACLTWYGLKPYAACVIRSRSWT
jgi:MFS family permease